MTLVEVMALGRPVLCTETGNGASIVKSAGFGLCYTSGSKQDFLQKLSEISEFAVNTKLSLQAKKSYAEKFTPEMNYRVLKNIYDRVCVEYGK